MNWKRHTLEAVTLIIAGTLCAVVANAMASRERKLALVGNYPNALKVPVVATETSLSVAPPTSAATPVVTTTTMSPAPGNPPIPITTTTIAPTTTAAPIATTATAAPAPVVPPAPKIDIAAKFPPHPDKAAVEIGHADVAALHAAGALFLDARRTSIFEQGHIAGARPFSVWESDIDDKVNRLFEERSDPRAQAQPIVIYCSGGECEDSHMLANKLWGIQFNNVYVYKDGYPDWQKHGGAVRAGANP